MLLHNAGILTMDAGRRRFSSGALLIQDDRIARIARIGRSAELVTDVGSDVERIDLTGRWILPGLINTHVHTSQQLGRGLGDDVNLLTWLHERIWPYESSMTEEDSYVSTLLCGIEQVRSGVTCFAEPGGQFVSGNAARAVLWEDEIGSLETGKKADLVVIDPDTATMLPLHDPVANMVTAMHSHNVESVMCNGRWLMKDRQILTIDEREVFTEAKKHAAAIVKRTGIRLPNRFHVID